MSIIVSVATFATLTGGTADLAVTYSPAVDMAVMALVVQPVARRSMAVVDDGDGWFHLEPGADASPSELVGTAVITGEIGPEEFVASFGYSLPVSTVWVDYYA